MGSEKLLPEEYVFARAGRGDLEGIRSIYNEAIRNTTATFDIESKSIEERQNWFAEHDTEHPVFVILTGSGKVAAWGSLSRWSAKQAYDSSAEVSIYVDSAHQGQGLGSFLLTNLIESGRAAGLHMLLSRIAEGNVASLKMHARFGFRHVGTLTEVGRKFGRYVDVEIFEYRLE